MSQAIRLTAALALALVGCPRVEPPVDPGDRAEPDVAGVAGAADTVLLNARVLGEPGLRTIWLRGDRVLRVDAAEPAQRAEAPLRAFDAAGGYVLPGFHDAHVHLLSGGESLARVALAEAGSLDEVVAAVRNFAAEHPEAPWILGRGWQYDILPEGGLPGRGVLDAAVPDRPVLLESYDGHALWASSRALALAGVDATTPDPPDGTIVREPGSRAPSGVLLDGAGVLVERAVPVPDRAERLRSLEAALAHCLRLGITSLDDFESDPSSFDLYAELEAAGRLPLRVRVSLPLDGDLDSYDALRRRHATAFLGFGHLKGFLDGVIEARTAFLLSPYAGTSERGRPLLAPDELHARVVAAQRRGFPVALHAIGDAAVRLALDSFERAARAAPRPGLHHRIEHIEVVDRADLPRFAALGVLASMQPFHANPFGDDPDAGIWSRNLGPERLRASFAWRELLAAGAPLVFGSDWPVMSADPLLGLAVAQTRRDAQGRPAGGWNAHQAIDAAAALSAYAGSVGAGGAPRGGGGRVRAGLPADLVILYPGVDPAQPASLWQGERVRAVFVAGALRSGSLAPVVGLPARRPPHWRM
jgi:predicted amidohydrolase YtcJ